jgi:hypothetical protein
MSEAAMTLEKLSLEQYNEEISVLESNLSYYEEQLSRYRHEEKCWSEGKKRIEEQISLRDKEICFIYSLLLEQEYAGNACVETGYPWPDASEDKNMKISYWNKLISALRRLMLIPDHNKL